MNDKQIEGCLVAGRQGLCIDAKGRSNPNSAGILVAISDQAAKLEPNSHPPTVILEFANCSYYIQKYGITVAILKKNSQQAN